MGKTLLPLAKKDLECKAIFNNRFTVECVECFHIHYRNLRIALSTIDFIELTKGCVQAFERWNSRGCPENPKTHIELCRKSIARYPFDEGIKVNLNENLYNLNKDNIFSEGADFDEPKYIHLKIRDLRLEMSINEFKELANVIQKASNELEMHELHEASFAPVQVVPQGNESK